MASLLRLPRELRDQIYEYLIQQRFDAAPALRVTPPCASDGLVYYENENAKWQNITLLAVNRQLRTEVLDLTSQQRKNGNLRAELDIHAHGYVYTPSWTFLNFALHPKDKLDLLEVNLHIHSTEAFRRNDGWPRQPGQIFRTLISFLSRFIFRGPSCLDASPPFEVRGPHFIKHLSVNIYFHDYYTPDTWPATVHEIFKMLKTLSMLDTAYRYLGQVSAETSYTRQGEDIHRRAEWIVRPGGQSRYPMGAQFKETEWARMGFHFGESWLQWYINLGERD